MQERHQLVVEIGHRARNERHGAYDALAGVKKELVVDKVKRDLKGIMPEGDRSGGHATRCNVERCVPPMIDVGMQFEFDLADDLHPHMDRAIGLLPLGERQSGPEVLALGLAEGWKCCPAHIYLLSEKTLQRIGPAR